jgi:hypothetical protein
MRRHRRVLFSLLFLALSGGVALAQEDFSADIVDLQKPGNPVLAKLYSTKGKRRIDFQPASGDRALIQSLGPSPGQKEALEVRVSGAGKAVILDISDKTSVILEPEQKMYKEDPAGREPEPSLLYRWYAYIRSNNPEDACTQWMQQVKSDGASCKKSGYESVDGRRAVRYEVSGIGEPTTMWLDPSLHISTRRRTKWTSTELRNVRAEPQPSTLFEIPKDYKPMSDGFRGVIGTVEPE